MAFDITLRDNYIYIYNGVNDLFDRPLKDVVIAKKTISSDKFTVYYLGISQRGYEDILWTDFSLDGDPFATLQDFEDWKNINTGFKKGGGGDGQRLRDRGVGTTAERDALTDLQVGDRWYNESRNPSLRVDGETGQGLEEIYNGFLWWSDGVSFGLNGTASLFEEGDLIANSLLYDDSFNGTSLYGDVRIAGVVVDGGGQNQWFTYATTGRRLLKSVGPVYKGYYAVASTTEFHASNVINPRNGVFATWCETDTDLGTKLTLALLKGGANGSYNYANDGTPITTALSGGTVYWQDITVPGVELGDRVLAGFNNHFTSDLYWSGQVGTINAYCYTNNVVRVFYKIEFYLPANPIRNIWVKINK